MRRIGLLIDSMVGGGAERIVLNFHSVLTQMGHEAHIFLIKNEIAHNIAHIPEDQLHILSEDGVLAKSRVINKWLLARRLKQAVKTIEADGRAFDFFISNAEDADRISRIAGLENVFIRYRNSMSYVIESKMGNKSAFKKAQRKRRFTRKFKRIYGGRHIVTVSKALARDIVDTVGVKPRSITTIYNPFNFEAIRALAAEPADTPDEPYIIYAAKFENRKRHDVLIKAFHQARVPHKLVLIGDYVTESDKRNYQAMLALIEELGLKDRIILAGFQKNPYPWIRRAELFAMSSDSEGLPTVLIESLILGTKVVSTDCPTGPSEILTGELSRFLSPTGDHEALARNIEAALRDYPEIGEPQIRRFNDRYAAGQYLELYERLSG